MIILSLPYNSKRDKYLNDINPSLDLIEYRVDYQKKLKEIDYSKFSSRTILTIRDEKEGGKNAFSRNEKLRVYNNAIQNTKTLVDDEILHYLDETPLIDSKHLILSWHAIDKDSTYQMLPEIIALSNRIPSRFLKIAIHVDNYTELQLLHSEMSQSTKPVLLAGLGKLGKLTRLLYPHLGAVGTYVGLKGRETALNQLNYEESLMFRLPEITAESLIGGIIGGNQVCSSPGLKHYNALFKKKDISAHYLPFNVEDWDDFWCWFLNASEYITFYGFSITMPWKKKIAASIDSAHPVLNTFLPYSYAMQVKPWELNTDECALKKSLDYLKISNNASVLIFGSGAMAELVLKLISGSMNISLYGRNASQVNYLKRKYQCQNVSKDMIKVKDWDLLINCTPLGMGGESTPFTTGDIHFKALIDLPHGKWETGLVRFSKVRKIPCVSGKMFWNWQSKEQEKLFIQEISKLTTNQEPGNHGDRGTSF
jgi:3-dehydroquinate dehydratase type I